MTTAAAPTATPFPTPQAELAYIRARAAALGLDPNAVLAVAAHEGVTLPAGVGDNGTSFGPFQLHIGGRLPTSIAAKGPDFAKAWADSPAGVEYALLGISGVARGQTGDTAITSIVTQFENPAAPAPEIAAAEQSYAAGSGPILGTSPSFGQLASTPGASGSPLGGIPGGGAVKSAESALTGWVGDLTGWLTKEAATGLAYVVFTLLGIALVLFGGLEVFGYTPSRVARGILPVAGSPGSSRLARGDTIPY